MRKRGRREKKREQNRKFHRCIRIYEPDIQIVIQLLRSLVHIDYRSYVYARQSQNKNSIGTNLSNNLTRLKSRGNKRITPIETHLSG